MAIILLLFSLMYLPYQVINLMNPSSQRQFNMACFYWMVTLIVCAAYFLIICGYEQENKSFFLHAINLHWFRIIIRMLDIE